MARSPGSQFILVIFLLPMCLRAQDVNLPGTLNADSVSNFNKIETGLSYTSEYNKTLFSNKIDFTGLNVTNERSVFDFLQGKISGLDIISPSGDPEKNAQAIVRGQNIPGGNSPLIVIDGIPCKPLDNFFNSYNYYGEDIRSLIPVPLEDIKSVEVLKDGSSTSLFGAEGAEGVILIETKRGSRQKFGLTYQCNQSIIKKPSFRPMLNGNEYVLYQLEALHNAKGVFDIPPEIAYDPDYAGFYNYSANTDWLKAVTQTGYATNQYVNFSGGNEKNRYYGSINYLDQRGTIINTGYTRLLNRFNFEHYFTKKLTLALDLDYAINKYSGNMVLDNEYGQGTNVLEMAFKKAPNMSIWEYDAEGNLTGEYFAPLNDYQGSGEYYFNPVAVSELGSSESNLKELVTTAHLQYDFKNWLKFRETFSYKRSIAASKTFLPYSAIGVSWLSWLQPLANTSDLGFEESRNEIQTFVEVPFKDEKKNMLNGTFTWILQGEDFSTKHQKSGGNFIKDSFGKSKNAVVSSLYYKLLDRYILNVNSRFESFSYGDNKPEWNNHYGITMGWRFMGEPFLKKFQFLNSNSMIHAGWSFSEYQSDDMSIYYYYEPRLKTQTRNLGLELGLFHNRLNFTSDYYTKNYEVKNYLGLDLSAPLIMKSKGWECMMDYVIIQEKNLEWNIQFNIAKNDQIATKIPEGIYTSESSTLQQGRYMSNLIENKPIGSIYGLIYEGVFPTDQDAVALDEAGNVLQDGDGNPVFLSYHNYTFKGGDAKYKDLNYDGIIDEDDVVYLGHSLPEYTGGFGSTVRFRSFTLTCNFHYRSGYKIINQAAMNSEGLNFKDNQSRKELNRWRIPGQESAGALPRAYADHPANSLGSDRFVEDGGFVKMNYLCLGYNIKADFCRKIHVRELYFSLSAQRLFTFSNYSGTDPEIEKRGNKISSMNKDEIRVTPPKVYTISIRLTI